MWRLPIMNLCFVLILIAILALQHSASVFVPAETTHVAPNNDSRKSHADAVSRQTLTGGDGLRNAFRYVSDLWQRSIILRQWTLENETGYWGTLRAASGVETELVEARFHVANAEVFDAALGERPRAKAEIGQAESYLMATRPLLTDRILPRVESIRQELEAASMNSVAIIYENSERFERIKTDLDRLIETVRAAKVRLEISTQPIHEGNSNAYRN